MMAVVAVTLSAAVAISAVLRPASPGKALTGVERGAGAIHSITHAPPTPRFARFGALDIHLPVAPEAVTTMAFHQASYSYAQHMTSLVKETSFADARRQAKRTADAAKKAGLLEVSSEATGPVVQTEDGVWTGKAIRLWRSGRSGKPDTAVDVGASPGTLVVSPVNGRVTLVKAYKLYDKYPDYEIHIEPEGHPGYEVILMHVQAPAVHRGYVVAGGVTPLAKVRRLSKLTTLQLKSYTADGGDHVHVQINRLNEKSPPPLPDEEGFAPGLVAR